MFIDKHPIPNLEHLALAVGLKPEYIRDVVARRIDPYREFQVAKARGSVRTITAPEPDLARAQRWILDNMFQGAHAGASSFAYRKGISVRDCASAHVGARWLVKLDLQNFFHSINSRRVARIFRKVGCDEVTSVQLAKLCTRRNSGSLGPYAGRIPLEYLPQGAPTSGMLANLAAENLDRSLSRLANRRALEYTRYSDDLTFSSKEDFSRASAIALIRSARGEIARNGFGMNEDKIRVSPPGSRLVVLGLLVDSDRVRLRGDFKKTLNWHVYGCTRFGLDKYSVSQGFSSIGDYQTHVTGLFAHAVDIEPEWAGPLQRSWKEISAKRAEVELSGSLVSSMLRDRKFL